MTTAKPNVKIFGRVAQHGGRCTGCKKWIYAQTRKQWRRAVKSPMCPLRQEGMVTVEPLEVRCTACGAAAGESCTTIVGDVRTPHAPRVQLATHPDPCARCSAGHGEPCRKLSGATSMYPHRARLRVGRNTEDIAWMT